MTLSAAAFAALSSPTAALAQGSGSSPPAGGGETGQIVIGTIVMALLTAAVLGLVSAHRSGRTMALQRLADFSGRQVGLPGWAALPLAIAGGSGSSSVTVTSFHSLCTRPLVQPVD